MQDEHVAQCIPVAALHLHALTGFCLYQSFRQKSASKRRHVNRHQQRAPFDHSIVQRTIELAMNPQGSSTRE